MMGLLGGPRLSLAPLRPEGFTMLIFYPKHSDIPAGTPSSPSVVTEKSPYLQECCYGLRVPKNGRMASRL